jgi:hypothetical protein
MKNLGVWWDSKWEGDKYIGLDIEAKCGEDYLLICTIEGDIEEQTMEIVGEILYIVRDKYKESWKSNKVLQNIQKDIKKLFDINCIKYH